MWQRETEQSLATDVRMMHKKRNELMTWETADYNGIESVNKHETTIARHYYTLSRYLRPGGFKFWRIAAQKHRQIVFKYKFVSESKLNSVLVKFLAATRLTLLGDDVTSRIYE